MAVAVAFILLISLFRECRLRY